MVFSLSAMLFVAVECESETSLSNYSTKRSMPDPNLPLEEEALTNPISENLSKNALVRLQQALGVQHFHLAQYAQPSELRTYETLRTLDDLYFRDLMEPNRTITQAEQTFRIYSGWGTHQALKRVLPSNLLSQPFQDLPSHPQVQAQIEDFVFHCGILEMAERYEGLLREGIFTGEVRPYPEPDRQGMSAVIILRSHDPSYSDEEIGASGLRWAGEWQVEQDRPEEEDLEHRFNKIEPELFRRVHLASGWRMTYEANSEIDAYFMEYARLYLRRIFSQDLIGTDEIIGGRPFSQYREVLTVLSALSQKHIAFSAQVKSKFSGVPLRGLLTTFCDCKSLVENIARRLDADVSEVEELLIPMTLSAENLGVHQSATTWAPLVRASADSVIFPMHGLDLNPFTFLLADLRARYQSDWFKLANTREARWIKELEQLFPSSNWDSQPKNLRLKDGERVCTDIDFAVVNRNTSELGLFQLKWQQPVGIDNRGRRSAGRNLLAEGNRWVTEVHLWIEKYGLDELLRRLNFRVDRTPHVHLFVMGRYHSHLTGFDSRDAGAAWTDWSYFRRCVFEGGEDLSLATLRSRVETRIAESRNSKKGESLMLPIGDVAIVLNPTAVPNGLKAAPRGC